MNNNIEKIKKQLEYERDCLKECLNRDVSQYAGDNKNIVLYYQFVKEDLARIERSLEDFCHQKAL